MNNKLNNKNVTNCTNFHNKTRITAIDKKENYSLLNNYSSQNNSNSKSKLFDNKSPSYSNKTITVDLSSKKLPTANSKSNKELKIKNYFYKPKLVNLNLSPDPEESGKYFTNSIINPNINTDFTVETDISNQSQELKKEYYSLSKDVPNIQIEVLSSRTRSFKIKKIDLKTARSLSKNRKYSISSADSSANKPENNIQDEYSSANYSLIENLNQDKIKDNLSDIVSNLQSIKNGRSVSPKNNSEISITTTNSYDEKMINNRSYRMLNVLRLKNKLKTNKTEIE